MDNPSLRRLLAALLFLGQPGWLQAAPKAAASAAKPAATPPLIPYHLPEHYLFQDPQAAPLLQLGGGIPDSLEARDFLGERAGEAVGALTDDSAAAGWRPALKAALGAAATRRLLRDLRGYRRNEGLPPRSYEALRTLESRWSQVSATSQGPGHEHIRAGLARMFDNWRLYEPEAPAAVEAAPREFEGELLSRLRPDAKGHWAVEGAPQNELREALETLRRRRITTGFHEIIVARGAQAAVGSPEPGVLALSLASLHSFRVVALVSKVRPVDKLVHFLLYKSLQGGMHDDFHVSAASLKEFEFLKPTDLKKAVAKFRELRGRGFWNFSTRVLERLGVPQPQDRAQAMTVLQPSFGNTRRRQSVLSLAFDPSSRVLFESTFAGVSTRQVTPGGRFAFAPRQVLPGTDKMTPHLQFDAASRLLLVCHPDAIDARKVASDGTVSEKPEFSVGPFTDLKTPYITGAGYDALSGSVLAANFFGESEIWKIRPDGSSALVQRLPRAWGSAVIGAFFDPVARVFIQYKAQGTLTAWRIGADGRADERPAQIIEGHAFADITSLHFDPVSRLVLAGDEHGGVYVRRLAVDGTLSEEAEFLRAGGLYDRGLALDAEHGQIFFGSFQLRRMSLPEPPAARSAPQAYTGTRGQKALLDTWLEAERDSYGINFRTLAEALHHMKDPSWTKEFWERLLKGIPKTASLKRDPRRPLWTKAAREELSDRMPSLVAALRDPARLGRLLYALSALRLLYPFSLANSAAEEAIEWSRKYGLEFDYGELKVVPVSESFRAPIVYVDDAQGRLALELKIPGEDHARDSILPDSYRIARRMRVRYPADSGVAKPWFYGWWQGKIRMYNRERTFTAAEPFGVFIREHLPGKRYANADAWLAQRALATGVPERELRLAALTDAAVAAFRLHNMGLAGVQEHFYDMHPENFSVLESGGGALVDDFGAFFRRFLPYSRRSEETLRLLGFPDAQTLEEIAARMTERLTRGLRGAALSERARNIRRQLRLE